MRVAMAIGPLGYAGLVLAAAGSQLQPPERSAVQVTSVPIITVGGLLLLGDLYVRNR